MLPAPLPDLLAFFGLVALLSIGTFIIAFRTAPARGLVMVLAVSAAIGGLLSWTGLPPEPRARLPLLIVTGVAQGITTAVAVAALRTAGFRMTRQSRSIVV